MTADAVSAGASVVTAAIAIWAIVTAKGQIKEARSITRESTATNLYNHCLELSLDHPQLAEPALSGGFKNLVADPETAASYGWFVATLLLSCEEILAVTKNDPLWRASVWSTLDGHADYFRYRNAGHRPLRNYYSSDLAILISEIAGDMGNPPRAMALRMSEPSHA